MRLQDGVVHRLALHLDRLAESAAFLGYPVDRGAIEAAIAEAARGDGRLRLLVAPGGAFSIAVSPLPASPALAEVAVASLPVAASDWRLRHKTTARDFYDAARRASGAFEVLFTLPGGEFTEGSFTNLFVPRGDLLLTPPLAAGLLPGILRGALLAEGKAVETPLTTVDLDGGFFIGNALRGLLPARLRG